MKTQKSNFINVFMISMFSIFSVEIGLMCYIQPIFTANGTENIIFIIIDAVTVSLIVGYLVYKFHLLPIRGFQQVLGRSAQKQSICNLLFEMGDESVIVTDSAWNIMHTNPAFLKLFCEIKDTEQPQALEDILEEKEALYEINYSLNTSDQWSGYLSITNANGEKLYAHMLISIINDESDPDAKYFIIIKDVNHEFQAKENLEFLTKYDSATLLPNEFMLNEILNEKISAHKVYSEGDFKKNTGFVLAIYHLSGLRNIADVYGIEARNRLLAEIGDRLVAFLGTENVARKGDYDLAIILDEVFDEEDLNYMLSKVTNLIEENHLISGNMVKLQSTAGYSKYPLNGSSSEDMISKSLLAMHNANANEALAYSEEMQERVDFEETMRSELVHAVHNMNFEVVYQPQTSIQTGHMIGVETLLRWKMHDGTPVSPEFFIPELERMGAIYDVGLWVLRHCCTQGMQWLDEGVPKFTMAVNVSALQLINENFGSDVLNILSETHFPPSLLELELTESSMVQDPDAADHLMQGLSAIGVGISIDDFGTGYSSLAYLRRFKTLQKLKIDKSFIDTIEDGEENVITNAIINLAQSLNLKAIAEGVEHDFQQKYLQGHGCDEIQGYLYSKPLASEQLLEYISNHTEPKNVDLEVRYLG